MNTLSKTARELDAARATLGKIDDLLCLLGARKFRTPDALTDQMIATARDMERKCEAMVEDLKKQADAMRDAEEARAEAERRAESCAKCGAIAFCEAHTPRSKEAA